MYLRELEEGGLERATIMDRVASRALQVGACACSGGGANAQGKAGGPGWLTPREAGSPFLLIPPKALLRGCPIATVYPRTLSSGAPSPHSSPGLPGCPYAVI